MLTWGRKETIFTSNYARKGNDENSIAISIKPPEWYKGRIDLSLAPTWEMVMGHKNGELSNYEYTEMYLQLLYKRRFNPHAFVKSFPTDRPTFLLCYERPSDFCHRKILAGFVLAHTGVEIPEYISMKEMVEERKNKHVEHLLDF